MVQFTSRDLQQLLERCRGKKIAVVGDLMVDRYYWGDVMRISPEAPVPVVEVKSESTRLGGAANVANNIASLGGTPLMIGVVGKDNGGTVLRSLVRDAGFTDRGLIVDPSRPTTVKSRVIAHHQHVVRIDQESKQDVKQEIADQMLEVLRTEGDSLRAIILEDYNKGVVTKTVIHDVIAFARERGIPVAVDPKFNNFFEYQNVTVFKPNRKETEEALGMRLDSPEAIERAGRELMKRLQADHVLLTLGERGMSLFARDGAPLNVPTRARKVADVSGAGDTVIATLTMALAAGTTVQQAASLANYAGGVVCGEVGIVPIDPKALVEAILEDAHQDGAG